MEQYVGLDVSLEATSVCVMDGEEGIVWRGTVLSSPEAIAEAVLGHAPRAKRIVFESGSLAPWLWHGLRAKGLPVICVDARNAKNVLSLRINKTDAIDAEGLAQIARVGWYREVRVKALGSHYLRGLVVARDALVRTRRDLGNQIRGLLKVFGVKVGQARGKKFAKRVHELVDDAPALADFALPLLRAYEMAETQAEALERIVVRLSSQDERCRLLMTAPGIGPVIAMSYVSVIDDPARFDRSSSVGAYLGITPKRFQSGEEDFKGRISRRGDRLLRSHLVEAATVILTRLNKWCPLKAWGLKLAKRAGMKKARVAVARKLAVILHRMLTTGETFRWSGKEVMA